MKQPLLLLSLFLASSLCLLLFVRADKYDNAFYLQNVKSNLVLEVQNCKKTNAANIMSATKKSYQSENVDCQLFTYDSQKQQLVSLLDGQGTFVLDIAGGTGGNHVILWPSHDGANQKWALEGESITCKAANKLITEKGVNQIIGAAAPTKADNQKFVRVPFVKDLYYIINPIGKQLLTVESADNGAPVKTIAYPHKDIKSYWYLDGKTKSVRNAFSGRALDLAEGCGGNRAHTWLFHGQANQQWVFDAKTGLLSTCNKALTIKEQKFANGGTLALLPKDNNLTDYQRWFKLSVSAGEEEVTKLLTLINDSKSTVKPASPSPSTPTSTPTATPVVAGLARTAHAVPGPQSDDKAATIAPGNNAAAATVVPSSKTATESGGQAAVLPGATKTENATSTVEEIIDCKPEDEVVVPATNGTVKPSALPSPSPSPSPSPTPPPPPPSPSPLPSPVVPPTAPGTNATKPIGKCCPCPS